MATPLGPNPFSQKGWRFGGFPDFGPGAVIPITKYLPEITVPITSQVREVVATRVVPDPDVGIRWGKEGEFNFQNVDNTATPPLSYSLNSDIKDPDDTLHRTMAVGSGVAVYLRYPKFTFQMNAKGKNLLGGIGPVVPATIDEGGHIETYRADPVQASFGWEEVYPAQTLGGGPTVRTYSYSLDFLKRPNNHQINNIFIPDPNFLLPWNKFYIENVGPTNTITADMPFQGP